MSANTRWKLATALLAVTTIVATAAWHHGGAHPTRQAATHARAAGDPAPRRPIRVAANVLGLSEERLIKQIQSARSATQVATYVEQLRVIGTDTSVETLAYMIDDRRPGVPEAILGLFGDIATERAVARLVALLEDPRPRVRNGAVYALGSTGNDDARNALLAIAGNAGDPAQSAAIYALGAMGGDEAAAGLRDLAMSDDHRTAVAAVDALARIPTATAEGYLVALIDAADPQVRAQAIQNLPPTQDREMLVRLATLAEHGDPQTQAAAVAALARSQGDASIELLVRVAGAGSPQSRWAAVSALGEVGGPKAVAALSELLEGGDPNVMSSAAQALLTIGSPEARAALIGAALAHGNDTSAAVSALLQLQGDDITDALVDIVRNGNQRSRDAALPQLVRSGDADALALAIELATHGARNDRYGAMRALADGGSQAATEALLQVARTATGTTRAQAIEMALQARPGDPGLTQLLVDSMTKGRRDEASTAVWTLARIGTDDAKKALLAAAQSKDATLAQNAISALGQIGNTAEVRAALVAAAKDGSPRVKGQAVQQLLSSGAPEGLQLAEAALGGGDADLARQVVWGLSQRGTEGARLLARAASSGDTQIRAAAAQALGNTGDAASTDALVNLTRDSDSQVRAAALGALGNIGSDKAVAAVLDAAKTGKPEDRVGAMWPLAQLDDPRAEQTLAQLMSDPDESIASSAMSASYNGGAAIEHALVDIVGDDNASASRRSTAAQQLRSRGSALDATTEAKIEALLGGEGSRNVYYNGGFYDF